MVGFKSDFWVVLDWLDDFFGFKSHLGAQLSATDLSRASSRKLKAWRKKKHGGFLCLFQNMISNGLNHGDCNVCEKKNLDY